MKDTATGFLQGFNRSPMGDLPSLMIMAQQFKQDRDHRKNMNAFSQDMKQIMSDDSIPASEKYAMLGESAANLNLPEQAMTLFDYSGKAASGENEQREARKNNFFTNLSNITNNGDPNAIRNNQGILSKLVEAHPDIIKQYYNMGDHQTPVGMQIAKDKDGVERVAMMVYNTQTGTVGPWTASGSDDPQDMVNAVSIEGFGGMIRQGNEIANGKWKSVQTDWGDTILLEEGSGATKGLDLTSQQQDRKFLHRSAELVDELTNQLGITGELEGDTRKKMIIGKAAALAYRMSKQASKNMYPEDIVMGIGSIAATEDLDIMKELNDATTDDQQAKVIRKIAERVVGVTPTGGGGTLKPMGSTGTGSGKKKDDGKRWWQVF